MFVFCCFVTFWGYFFSPPARCQDGETPPAATPAEVKVEATPAVVGDVPAAPVAAPVVVKKEADDDDDDDDDLPLSSLTTKANTTPSAPVVAPQADVKRTSVLPTALPHCPFRTVTCTRAFHVLCVAVARC